MFKCLVGVLAASAMLLASHAYAGDACIQQVAFGGGQRVVVQNRFVQPQRVVVNRFGQRVLVNRNFVARDLRLERELRLQRQFNNQARINALRIQNQRAFVQNRNFARQNVVIRQRSIGRSLLGAAILSNGNRSVGRTLLGLSILGGL